MTDDRLCSQCKTELPPDAPGGLCPACMMKRGLKTNALSDLPTDWTPPAPTELAAMFPELEILELIGRGGMGAVYKVRQKRLERLAALKILPAEVARDPSFAERFTREARVLASLNHPNIVTVYDYGETDGRYWFLMEFVDGSNLRQMLNAGQITPREALAVVPPICDALQFAHDNGVVHRDIKPENILFSKSGRAKITDFGLAKLMVRGAGDMTLTGSGQTLGSPSYMAPEQIEKPETVDHRADIYSLGVVFYQMLTGELPLGRFAPPSQKVQIDVRLDEVVLKTLEKEPERRYQQVSEVKTNVETIGTNVSPPVTAPTAPVTTDDSRSRARKPMTRDARIILDTFAVFLVLMAATIVILLMALDEQRYATGSILSAIACLGSAATLVLHGRVGRRRDLTPLATPLPGVPSAPPIPTAALTVVSGDPTNEKQAIYRRYVVGRLLAIVGCVMLVVPLVCLCFAIAKMQSAFENAAHARGTVNASILANAIRSALLSLPLGFIGFILSVVCIGVALLKYKYRADWFFWVVCLVAVGFLPWLPVGTVVGILLLVYVIKRRSEFVSVPVPEPPAAPLPERRVQDQDRRTEEKMKTRKNWIVLLVGSVCVYLAVYVVLRLSGTLIHYATEEYPTDANGRVSGERTVCHQICQGRIYREVDEPEYKDDPLVTIATYIYRPLTWMECAWHAVRDDDHARIGGIRHVYQY